MSRGGVSSRGRSKDGDRLERVGSVLPFSGDTVHGVQSLSYFHDVLKPPYCACSLSAGSHPYVDYLKTLEFGGREGNYFDLPGLGGDKYGEWHLCMVECSLSLCLDFDILLGLGIFN